ncbi:MAG: M28 family peptidase, partial [Bryobacteraceae bacterium]
KTIADVNLEQLGRTDSTDGPQVATGSFTGFDYSEVPAIFRAASALTGVKVYKDDTASDAYFSRSDNQELADTGIPAHTLCVAFDFPDYHGVGDEWDKIDYGNMAKVDRMVAVGLLMLASDAPPPKWNESNSKARKYLEAWRKLHAPR